MMCLFCVFRVKTLCLILLRVGTKVLNCAELEGCEHRFEGLAVSDTMEKPGSHVVHCLELVSPAALDPSCDSHLVWK